MQKDAIIVIFTCSHTSWPFPQCGELSLAFSIDPRLSKSQQFPSKDSVCLPWNI